MDADLFLMHRIRNGDEAAIEAFVRKYYLRIFRYLRYRTKDRQQAEDLTQETFYRFFRSLSSYSHNGRLTNYLYRIAGNLCRDQWRATQIAMEELAEEVPDLSPFPSIDSRLDIERAIERLPKELREVIRMYFFLDMKLREIAEAEGIGLSLVKYRLKRGKELLKKELGEEGVR